jgi:hypothetical protein
VESDRESGKRRVLLPDVSRQERPLSEHHVWDDSPWKDGQEFSPIVNVPAEPDALGEVEGLADFVFKPLGGFEAVGMSIGFAGFEKVCEEGIGFELDMSSAQGAALGAGERGQFFEQRNGDGKFEVLGELAEDGETGHHMAEFFFGGFEAWR